MRYIKSYANDAAIQAAVDNKSLGHPYVALDDQLHRIDWNGKEETPDYASMYLTIEALSGGTFYVRNANVDYSVNGGAWQTTTQNTTTLALNSGDTVRVKCTFGRNGMFSGNTLGFNVYGNIESLVYGDNFKDVTTFPNNGNLNSLFSDSSGLVDASNMVLPIDLSKVSVSQIYFSMFSNCTNLEYPPKLPSLSLSTNCYQNMFSNTKITSIELPAPILVGGCYTGMFMQSKNLKYIKCLATDISATDCTKNWMFLASTTGTFVKKAGVTWSTGNSGIPSGWTVVEE